MSIISEALKRAQKKAETDRVSSDSVVPVVRPAADVKSHHRRKRIWWAIALIALGVAALVDRHQTNSLLATHPNTSATPKKPSPLPIDVAVQESPSSSAVDPVRDRVADADIRLQGVVALSPKETYALIDNHIVRTGQFVGEWVVENIEENGVVLRNLKTQDQKNLQLKSAN